MLKKTVSIVLSIFLLFSATAFAKTIIVSKDPSAVLFLAGSHYFNQNDFSTASNFFSKAIEFNPNFAEAYNNLGISLYKHGNAEDAIAELKNSVEIKTDYSTAYYNLALVYFEQKDFNDAILNFEKVISIDSSNANAHFDLAVSLVEMFREKENAGEITTEDLDYLKAALEHYQTAISLNPTINHAQENKNIVQDVLDYYSS